MPRRLIFVVVLLAAVALACANSTQQPVPSQAPLQAQVSAPANNAVSEPTQDTLYLPDVSVEPTQSILFLPDISSAGTPSTPNEENATVEIQVDRTTLRVGETFTATGRPVNVGMPYYYLFVKDEGINDPPPLIQVTYENQATPMDGSSQVLELVSAEGRMDQVIFVVRGKAPGIAGVSIGATGEVQIEGGMSWSGGGSDTIPVTITE